MNELEQKKLQVSELGWTKIENIYSNEEIEKIIDTINLVDTSKSTFRKSNDLFAIRQFLNEVPATQPLIFNKKLKDIIEKIFGKNYFVVKSIYFDKPKMSN